MTDLERVVALARKGRWSQFLARHPERPLGDFGLEHSMIRGIGHAAEQFDRAAAAGGLPGAGKALTKGRNVVNPATLPGRVAGYRRMEHGREEEVGGYARLKGHLLAHHPDVYPYLMEGRDRADLDNMHHTSHEQHPGLGHEYAALAAAFAQNDGLTRVREHVWLAMGEESQVKGFQRVVRGRVEEVRPHESMEHGWQHPFDVGGHSVAAVYTHPAQPNALYDLGHGLHAEGRPGRGKAAPFRPGPVMRNNGLDQQALAEKGWTRQVPPKPVTPTARGPVGTASGLTPGESVQKLAAQRAAKAKTTGNKGRMAASPYKGRTQAERIRAAHRGLADQQRDFMARAGYDIDPHDWTQDHVFPHEPRVRPDVHPSGDIKDLNQPGRPLGKAAGTAADPIDVQGNVHEALRQLAQGNHVRLNRATELTLLMQAVAQHAAETSAGKPADAPDWDFGRLSVKGTNLFTAQHQGYPRIDMPQFSGLAEPGTHAAQVAGGPGKFADLTDEFEQHLKDHGIAVTRTTMPAAHLKATQTELVGGKVAGFANAFLHGNPKAVSAMKEPIMVTRDGYVIDGHHRWGANMLADAVDGRLGNDTPMNVRRVDMDIGAMIPYANAWARQVGIASAAAKAGDTGAALKSSPK